ncbi:hypothetical protein B0H13DRAFT_2559701 [Mycena leptocephala]|nr:hypothetical protein B0H13DRAFT_2559701 [Mycena leptocephala]
MNAEWNPIALPISNESRRRVEVEFSTTLAAGLYLSSVSQEPTRRRLLLTEAVANTSPSQRRRLLPWIRTNRVTSAPGPNVQVFRDSLRCVKLWAQHALSFLSFFPPRLKCAVSRKTIYWDVNGFRGGVASAMLLAGIFQIYPKPVAGAIVVL